MKYLLDTNICICYLNGRSPSIKQKLDSLQPQDVIVCSVVKSELFYGAMKSQNLTKSLQMQEDFLDLFVSHSFDDKAAKICGKIRAYLAIKGTPIGPNDVMIAAIALSNNLILVTHNTREFSHVPDLEIEDWETSS
jgi:tRNA(fMet)-specific endonuclease VapC